jgi:hypothetical protein
LGQIRCEGTAVLHWGQYSNLSGFKASCALRLLVRALECFRFGTAMTIHPMPDASETPKLNEDTLLQCGKQVIVSDSPAGCQALEIWVVVYFEIKICGSASV